MFVVSEWRLPSSPVLFLSKLLVMICTLLLVTEYFKKHYFQTSEKRPKSKAREVLGSYYWDMGLAITASGIILVVNALFPETLGTALAVLAAGAIVLLLGSIFKFR